MAIQIKSKLPDVGITIFTEMSRLAMEHGAINLSQGFPDFDTYSELKALVNKYLAKGCNQYAPMQGVPELRRQLAEKTKKLYSSVYDPETEITITAGATEALFATVAACVRPGDEVILFEPAYDAYEPAVRLNGGLPVYCKLRFPDYRVDWNEVADALSPRTRLILINSPHNPTGMVLSAEDLENLAEVTRHTDVLLAGDEVYEHITYDDIPHLSLASRPELAERSFVISSFAKTYHTTGWKVGYCLAPKAMTAELQKVHQFLTFAVNTPIQHAYAEFIRDEQRYLSLAAFYEAKRDYFLKALRGSRFKPLACQGTYYVMLDYSEISKASEVDFARDLVVRHGVAAIPPSLLYHQRDDNHVLRFCFAKKEETLAAAAERLCQI